MAERTATQRSERVSRTVRSDEDSDRDLDRDDDRPTRRRRRRGATADVERLSTAVAESAAHFWRDTARIAGDLLMDTNDAIWGFARDNGDDDLDDDDLDDDFVDDDDDDRPRRRHRARRSVVGSVAHAVNESARATSDALDHFSRVNRPAERGRRTRDDDDRDSARHRETRDVQTTRGRGGEREVRHEHKETKTESE